MLLQELFCTADFCSPGDTVHTVLQTLVALFLAILFLQSGLDKVFDRKSNLSWLKSHFSNSPLRNIVPLLIIVITVLETAAGAVSAAGAIVLLWKGCDYWIFWGSLLAAVAILCLFFGQRLAKDYAGAQNLVSYFIVALIGIWLCM